MKKEFDLSKEREKVFDLMIKKGCISIAGRIYRIIKEQDKEFIKQLKEIIESEIFEIKNTNYEGCNKVKDEIIKEIDKLTGDLK